MNSKILAAAICIPLMAACVETTPSTAQKAAPNKTAAVAFHPAQSFTFTFLNSLPSPKSGKYVTKHVKPSTGYTFVLYRSKGIPEDVAKAQVVSICLNTVKGSVAQAEKQILPNNDLGLFIDCKK